MHDERARPGLTPQREHRLTPDAPAEELLHRSDLRADLRQRRAGEELTQRQGQLTTLVDQTATREGQERAALDRAQADLRERVRATDTTNAVGSGRQVMTPAVQERLDRLSGLQHDALRQTQERTREVLDRLAEAVAERKHGEPAQRDRNADARDRDLADRIGRDLRALDACQTALRDQFLRDQEAVERVVYDRRLDDSARQVALDAVLAEQAASHQDVQRQAEQLLVQRADDARNRADVAERQLAEYVRAFHGRFADHPALGELWDRARQDAASFDQARRRFWGEVNQGDSAAAEFVRSMLKAAGYQLQAGSNAPLLSMPEYASNPRTEGLRRADLLLSIDHANPMTNPVERTRLSLAEALDPENLRFMSGRDNSMRRNHYNEDDETWRKE
jgi:hypothetical protein